MGFDVRKHTFHDETAFAGARMAQLGSDIAVVGGEIKALGCCQIEPTSYQMEKLRDAISKCQDHLSAYEKQMAEHFAAAAPPVDDHQTDIEDGTASFEAYKAKLAERV